MGVVVFRGGSGPSYELDFVRFVLTGDRPQRAAIDHHRTNGGTGVWGATMKPGMEAREFVVGRPDEVFERYWGAGETPSLHEIVCGPCRAYLDIERKYGRHIRPDLTDELRCCMAEEDWYENFTPARLRDSDVVDAFKETVRVVIDNVRRGFDSIFKPEIARTVAVRACQAMRDGKCSIHLTFVCQHSDGAEIMFDDSESVGYFLRYYCNVINNDSLRVFGIQIVDPGPYQRNASLRTVWSRTPKSTNRDTVLYPCNPMDDDWMRPTRRRPTLELFKDHAITAGAAGIAHIKTVSFDRAEKVIGMKRSVAGSSTLPAGTDRLIDHVLETMWPPERILPSRRDQPVRKTIYRESTNSVLVSLWSRFCPMRHRKPEHARAGGSEHQSNHVGFIVYIGELGWQPWCHKCLWQDYARRKFPDDIADASRDKGSGM